MDYIINDSITNELLLNNGFRKVIYKNGIKKEYEYIYIKYLVGEVYMKISIYSSEDTMILDSIRIVNDIDGLPYGPFYTNVKNEKVEKIKEKFDIQMDEFVDLGIFKVNSKVLKREM